VAGIGMIITLYCLTLMPTPFFFILLTLSIVPIAISLFFLLNRVDR
jgi:hypothetical protein